MACLFITVGTQRAVGEFAFAADAALHAWTCFLKFHHFFQLIRCNFCSQCDGFPIDLVHQVQSSLFLPTFRRFLDCICSSFRPVRSSPIHHVWWRKPIDFGFFGDLILDRLQPALVPSSCYLSSVPHKSI